MVRRASSGKRCAEETDFEAVDCEGTGLVTACSARGIGAGKLRAGAQGRQGL